MDFASLAEKWLQVKVQEVKPRSFSNLKRYMKAAIDERGNKNIKDIGYAEIQDFLFSQNVSDKTRANIKSCLHTFWTWLRKRRLITLQQFPEFPEIKFTLGFRNIIDKATQEKIIDEVKRISYHRNPKIWLGVKWLATYIAIHPGELLKMTERDIDTRLGYFIVLHTKEGKEFSPEQIKAGTMHSTNKAFDRYLQVQTDDALSIYAASRNGKQKKLENL